MYQQDQIVQAKDEAIEHLKSQITPLKTTSEEFPTLTRDEILRLTILISPIDKAMAYFLNGKKQLSMYLHDGKLLMDTSLIENIIRPKELDLTEITLCSPDLTMSI